MERKKNRERKWKKKRKMEKNKNKVKSDIIFITLKLFHLFYMINVNIK